MRLIDLSQPVYHESPNYPTHPAVRCEVLTDHPTDGWRTEMLVFPSHTGSHLDAPLHKIPTGISIDAFPLETFAGPAFIADLRDSEPVRKITAEVLLAKLPRDLAGAAVILGTGWGAKRSRSEEWQHLSPRLTVEGAEWLVSSGVRGVGIDHFSVGGTTEPENSATHSTLLGAHVWILEDLRLPEDVFSIPQPCMLWCLPVHLKGHGGAPCRPVIAVG